MIEPPNPGRRRGVSAVGIVVTVVCVVVLVAVFLVTLQSGMGPRRRDVRSLKNTVQLTQVHQAMLIFANNENGQLPVPGLINRLADPNLGEQVPGIGPEDESINTTANLYSALIAQQYFNPDLLISPLERNPAVIEDLDYDLQSWQPQADQYWDPAFTADLATGSNVSFAHRSLHGFENKTKWRSSASREVLQIGSRGPASGVASSDSLACSNDGSWVGSLVFADNHGERVDTREGSPIRLGWMDARDNPFAADAILGDRDAFIAFTRRVTASGPEFQHD